MLLWFISEAGVWSNQNKKLPLLQNVDEDKEGIQYKDEMKTGTEGRRWCKRTKIMTEQQIESMDANCFLVSPDEYGVQTSA